MEKKMKLAWMGIAIATSGLVLTTAIAAGTGAFDIASVDAVTVDTTDKSYGSYRLWIGTNGYSDNTSGDPFNTATVQVNFYADADKTSKKEQTYSFVGGNQSANHYGNSEEGAEGGYRDYYWVDIDPSLATGTYVEFVVTYSGGTVGTSSAFPMTAENLHKILFVWYDNGTLSGYSFGFPDKVSKWMAAEAMECLNSCSASPINGYASFGAYLDGFYAKKVGEFSEIPDYALSDYEAGSDWTLEGAAKTATVTPEAKFNFMNEMYLAWAAENA